MRSPALVCGAAMLALAAGVSCPVAFAQAPAKDASISAPGAPPAAKGPAKDADVAIPLGPDLNDVVPGAAAPAHRSAGQGEPGRRNGVPE